MDIKTNNDSFNLSFGKNDENPNGITNIFKKFLKEFKFRRRLLALYNNPKIKSYRYFSEKKNLITPENIDVFEKIAKNPVITDYNMPEFFNNLSKENFPILELVVNNFLTYTYIHLLPEILAQTNASNIELVKKALMTKDFPVNYIEYCIKSKNEMTKDRIEFVINKMRATGTKVPFPELHDNEFCVKRYYESLADFERGIGNKILIDEFNKCLKHPQLYVDDSEGDTKQEMKEYRIKIKDYFKRNRASLRVLAFILGEAAFDDFLRYRFDTVDEYLNDIDNSFSVNDMKLLKNIINSKNENGNNFSSQEKLELFDTVIAYLKSDFDIQKLKKMVEDNKVNIKELSIDILKKIFKNSTITEKDGEKWNLKYISLLVKELDEDFDENLPVIAEAANNGTFSQLLKNNEANNKTAKLFQEYGLNYDIWTNPPEALYSEFKLKDKNTTLLEQTKKQFSEDIETLRKTPAKHYIDKVLNHYIDDDKFIIPDNYTKEQLANIITNALIQLKKLWERASNNAKSNNADIRDTANKVLTIKNHLEQRIKDIKIIKSSSSEKSVDWKIKLWDRNPCKDLFQGNYSTCCIGMCEGNSNAITGYLLNTMFNMIEIVDNKTQKTVGNALVYYVIDSQGNLNFAIDNIEINNANKLSENAGIELRKKIIEFSKKINNEVAKNPNIPIILGTNYNDIPDEDLLSCTSTVKTLGEYNKEKDDEVYLDLFSGWTSETEKNINFYKLFQGYYNYKISVN